MAIKYWAKVGGEKKFFTTLERAAAYAERHAEKIGRKVMVGYDSLTAGRGAIGKTFNGNPAKKVSRAQIEAARRAVSKAQDKVWDEADAGPSMVFSEAKKLAPVATKKYVAALDKLEALERRAQSEGSGYFSGGHFYWTRFNRNPIAEEVLAHELRMRSARAGVAKVAKERGERRRARMAPKAPKRSHYATATPRPGEKLAASDQGKAARRAGYSEADNPYPAGTLGHTLWKSGFNRNPTTPAAKARKKAAHKRGAYLVFRHGGKEQRIKFANKGLATIAAKDYKAAGYAGVRVIGA